MSALPMSPTAPSFRELMESVRTPDHLPIPRVLCCFDPGETTGVAVFQEGRLRYVGQLATHNMRVAPPILFQFFNKWTPSHVVVEDYRVYSWKTDSHSWDNLHTARVIGCIETLCILLRSPEVPLLKQTAQQGKSFCTDEKLKHWGFYTKAFRHGRDAVRHGCYYLLFQKKMMVDQRADNQISVEG